MWQRQPTSCAQAARYTVSLEFAAQPGRGLWLRRCRPCAGGAPGIILLAFQVLLQTFVCVPRQCCGRRSGSVQRRTAHVIGASCAQYRSLWRHTQARAEIAVMRAADVWCAMALNIGRLQLCRGRWLGLPCIAMRCQTPCFLRAASTYTLSQPLGGAIRKGR